MYAGGANKRPTTEVTRFTTLVTSGLGGTLMSRFSRFEAFFLTHH
jgi:hypothetical protein